MKPIDKLYEKYGTTETETTLDLIDTLLNAMDKWSYHAAISSEHQKVWNDLMAIMRTGEVNA